jgi:cytochrome c-type biogenesis protein CcmH
MIKQFRNLLCLVALLCITSTSVLAAIDAYEFTDQKLQHRYRVLVEELRCPQCLNTNLSGSDSMIAKDLRREIYNMVQDGKTDDEIREFMYERYGDFILYRPSVNNRTMFLWFGPGILLLLGMWFIYRIISRRRVIEDVALSGEDSARLEKILQQTDKNT